MLNIILHHSGNGSNKQSNHSHLEDVWSPLSCLKADQRRVGVVVYITTISFQGHVPQRPWLHTRRRPAVWKWNYQDKHQPAWLPSPFLLGPPSAPPPANSCVHHRCGICNSRFHHVKMLHHFLTSWFPVSACRVRGFPVGGMEFMFSECWEGSDSVSTSAKLF